ncbi:putative bifunctional diguanylate cyclase/phosphodiesterase [Hoeflea sp.]|uniref:putative bifunctional diguanylate cyclase/phosphodiesterase n=1 Tax=Hoeflea sp. TaxID=1940281 RepID=UPI003B529650
MRLRFNIFNLFGVGVVAAFLAIVLVHSNLVESTENAMERSSRFDVAWVGAGGRLEAYALQKSLARYAFTRAPGDARQVRLFTDIVTGRFGIFASPTFEEFLDSKATRRERLTEAAARFDRLVPEFKSIETVSDDRMSVLISEFETVLRAIDRVGAEAHSESVNHADAIRRELHEKQSLQKWLATTLFVLIALLLGLAAIQNHFLGRAGKKAMRAARDFSYLAHHDNLTGLPNRMAFNAEFDNVVERLRGESERRVAVFAIDLDGFKVVNDRYGHATGDTLLKQATARMSRTCDGFENCIMTARLGGDEFVVMMNVDDDVNSIVAQAELLREALSNPYDIDGTTLVVSASIGIKVSSPERDASQLLIGADIALSQAKAAGKDRVLLFDPSMHDAFIRETFIQSELTGAIENDEITPHYQIKVDVGTGRVVGAEVLARWTHPSLGPISPAEFTKIAERSGQIVPLGRKILERACRDALNFPPDMGIAVNLSVLQFVRDDLVQTVSDVLEETGFPASRLTLEVTESLMISEADRAAEILSRFREMGVSVALDDFGTGYSALSYLRTFDWDELKIDRSFVKELETDERAGSIVGSIVSMAHQLGIKVTAEGAETPRQIEILRDAGSDTIQGYHFGRPVPFCDFPAAILQAVAAAARLERQRALRQVANFDAKVASLH